MRRGTRSEYLDYHLHNIIIKGMAVEGEHPFYDDLVNVQKQRYKRFNFKFHNSRYDTYQTSVEETPYLLKDGQVYYQGALISDLPFERIIGIDDCWGSESAWYFKVNPYKSPFYELRLNPVNLCANLAYRTGNQKQFHGCAFCHRVYTQRRVTECRQIYEPKMIFTEIIQEYGKEVFAKIEKVLMITGDTKKPEQLLGIAEEIYNDYLIPNGFRGTFSLATNQLRQEEHLQRLAALDSTIFEFPLETFSRREELLGPAKGLDFKEVLKLFRIARKYFRFIRINYVVGLESLAVMEEGFQILVKERLIDDVIANYMIPFIPEMKALRVVEANEPEFLFKARELLLRLGLQTRRGGVTKNIFNEYELPNGGVDQFILRKAVD